MNFDRLDKILLIKDDVEKIMTWDHDNHHKFDSLDFPITEGVLIIQQKIFAKGKMYNVSSGTYFGVTPDGIRFTIYSWDDNKKEKMASTFFDDKTNVLNLDIEIYYSGATKKMLQKDFQHQILLLLATFQYMNHHKEAVDRKEEKRAASKKPKSGKATSSKRRFTKFTSVQYSFDFSKEGIDKRNYERHTESWTQRGFYRHYKKSGKIVWIDPQVKGSKNIETEGKVYKP